MNFENIQLTLQAISVIGVPILTAFIGWIANSLRKTNKRIDSSNQRINELRDEVHDNRLQDTIKLSDLSGNVKAIGSELKHLHSMTKGTQEGVHRIEGYLMRKEDK